MCIEKLIELVKIHPILFDLTNPEYKNVLKKDNIWKNIAEALNQDSK